MSGIQHHGQFAFGYHQRNDAPVFAIHRSQCGLRGICTVSYTHLDVYKRQRQSNPAFWIVTLSALSLLFLVTRFEGPGHPFRFAPPPLDLSLVALLLPLLVLGLAEGWRGIRLRRARGSEPISQER